MAGQNYVLPLSRPTKMEGGELMHETLIPKGTCIVTFIAAYDRFVLLFLSLEICTNDVLAIRTCEDKKEAATGPFSLPRLFCHGGEHCRNYILLKCLTKQR